MNENHRIQFEKPDLPALVSQYTVVDLHFHTNYSDGAHSVGAVAEHAKNLGIGVAITDHNEIRGALEIDANPHVLSIPGIEVTSSEGTHLLIYFYDIDGLKGFYGEHVKPNMGKHLMSSLALTLESLIERARAYRSVIIFPHPYSAVFTGVCNSHFPEPKRHLLFDRTDGIEAINGSNLNRWNLKGALLGFNLGKALTGGSDGHSIRHLGCAVTYAPCAGNRRAFLDAVREKQSRVIGKEMALLRKMTANGAKLKTNIRNYPDLVEKNLRYSYLYFNIKSRTVRESVKRSINGRIRWMRNGL